MDLKIRFTGTTPLLQHNIKGMDPTIPAVREKDALVSRKSKITAAEQARVDELDWNLALYLDEDGRVVVPTRNIKKCLIDSGKITRNGTDVIRALSFRELDIPLEHSGNGSIQKMYESGDFTSRMAVGVGQKRIMRIRPQFMPWSLEFTAFLFEDAMDPDVFVRIVERAGVTIGLLDNRTNGYGRFEATIEETG